MPIKLPFRIKKFSRYTDSELISIAFCVCVYSSVTTRYMNYTNILLIALVWKFILGEKKYRVSPIAFCWALYILIYPMIDAVLRGPGLSTFDFLCYFAPLSVFLAGNVKVEDFGKALIVFAKGFAWFQTVGIIMSMTVKGLYYTVASKVLGSLPHSVCGFATYSTMASYVICVGLGAYMIEFSIIRWKTPREKMICLIKILVLFFGLTSTMKRTFLVSTVLSFMIVMMLNSLKSPRRVVITFVVIVIAVVGVYSLSMYFYSIGSSNAFGRLGGTFVGVSEGEDVSNMRSTWAEFMAEWKKGHEVFGIGWEGFKIKIYETPYGGAIPNGHNVYKQIDCEEGHVGLAVYVALELLALLAGIVNILITIGKNTFAVEMAMWPTYIIIVYIIYCYTGNAIYESMIYLYFFGAIYIVSGVNQKLLKLRSIET